MSAVYKAMDMQLDGRPVALKEMSQQALTPEASRKASAAFAREIKILARLKHQGLPQVYGQFEENRRYYLVMEFIEGESLAQYLERRQTMPMELVVTLGIQLCTILDYLHRQEPPIIFRDLKPSNIMFHEAENRASLIDFGIARFFTSEQLYDTAALGTAGYAPPEQHRRSSSPRSDIYSLGATFHQLLTGIDPSEHPFVFQPLSVNAPALEDLVTRMISLDAQQRPASAREVLVALETIQQGSPSAPPQPLLEARKQPEPQLSGQNAAHVVPTAKPETPRPAKQAGKKKSAASPARRSNAPMTICAVLSASEKDQQLWRVMGNQLSALVTQFLQIRIVELVMAEESQASYARQAMEDAHLVLLLLSSDFLASPACMAMADMVLDRYEGQDIHVLSVLLQTCTLYGSRLFSTRVIPHEPVAHGSAYAQERNILEAAQAIREQLISLSLKGKTSGPMTLHQWLLLQWYSDGRLTCPFFLVGHYALRHARPMGNERFVVQLLDLHGDHVLAERLVGPLHGANLSYIQRVIAPAAGDPRQIRGVAARSSHPPRQRNSR